MFFAACEGYFDKLEDTAGMFRVLCTVVNRSMGGDANMQTIWPLHSDTKQEAKQEWTRERVQEMVKNANKHFLKHR